MAAIDSGMIALPRDVAQGIVKKAKNTSTIQTLSPASPMLFKDVEHLVFTKEPEAEFVAEGGRKSASEAKIDPVPGGIHKAQVTVRLSNEVEWADEDNQLQIIDAVTEASARAVGRALDYGVYHAINPNTGTAISTMTALTAGAKAVNATSDPTADMDSLVDAVAQEYDVSGIALSKAFASTLRKVRVAATGQRMYPEIPLNLQAGTIDGIPAATSNTVNGALAKTPTNVLAILGDFGLIRWGIVRDMGMEVITMGDPDGQGDLKNLNQVAYRTEVVYSWAVLDPKGFAVLKAVGA